jgi:hypothetical protein
LTDEAPVPLTPSDGYRYAARPVSPQLGVGDRVRLESGLEGRITDILPDGVFAIIELAGSKPVVSVRVDMTRLARVEEFSAT